MRSIRRRSANAVPDQIDAAHLHSDLHSVIDQLNEREKELLTHHYGLNNTTPAMSLTQIGDKMGITKARVRQLEGRALRKLRLLLETRREKLHNATTLNPPARRVPGRWRWGRCRTTDDCCDTIGDDCHSGDDVPALRRPCASGAGEDARRCGSDGEFAEKCGAGEVRSSEDECGGADTGDCEGGVYGGGGKVR